MSKYAVVTPRSFVRVEPSSLAQAIRRSLLITLIPLTSFGWAQSTAPAPAQAAQETPAEDDIEEMEGIEVQGERIRGKEADNEEERANMGVTEVLSNAQLTVAGDSDSGAALKRVTGLSTVGGKFVYVRGLGERYSSVLLNGAQIPSPDPLRRVVPLDLFPTDVLDSITVQKSGSAEYPGEFGGGTLLLRTKEAQQKRYLKTSVGTGYVSGSTGQTSLRYRGGSRDYLGHDSGARDLPGSLSALTTTSNAAARRDAGLALAERGFAVFNRSAQAPITAALSTGGSKAFESFELSSNFGFRYAQSFDDIQELRQSFSSGGADQALLLNKQLMRDRGERQVDVSGLASVSASIGDHRLDFTTLLLRQTLDQAQVDLGFTDAPDEVSRFTELEWVENALLIGQLGGSHYFSDLHELLIDWKLTEAKASRDAPLKRRYRYDRVNGQFEFSRRTDGNDISDEALDDRSSQLQIGAQMPFTYREDVFVNVLTGLSLVDRKRESDLRRFKYSIAGSAVTDPVLLRQPIEQVLSASNIGPNGFELIDITRSVDNYQADQDISAFYLAADINYQDLWRFGFGVRVEKNDQRVTTFDRNAPLLGNIQGKIDDTDALPSLNIGYTLNEQTQLRFSYSRSLSRPDFRELSPAPFFDPLLDVESFGNPNLKATTIDNLDLRYENYADTGGQFSAALFAKRFDQPVERIVVPGTGELLSYENADSGNLYGIELETYQPLTDYLPENFWARDAAFFSTNVALMKSKVSLSADAGFQTNRNRALQGQSNALINLQLGFSPSPDNKLSGVLSFNRAAKRIAQVGVLGAPDIFEQPFDQLDLSLRYALSEGWSIGLKAKNLLDEQVQFTQGGGVVRGYKPGVEAGISIEWSPEFNQ
jgi:outer membrane receptor protein involved in Fe transport